MLNLIKKLEEINLDQINLENHQFKIKVYGLLCLLKEMLAATEIYGLGDIRAHNSLVTISMIKVKVWNNASYGDDVPKCF